MPQIIQDDLSTNIFHLQWQDSVYRSKRNHGVFIEPDFVAPITSEEVLF